jgi:hypothetical protein
MMASVAEPPVKGPTDLLFGMVEYSGGMTSSGMMGGPDSDFP